MNDILFRYDYEAVDCESNASKQITVTQGATYLSGWEWIIGTDFALIQADIIPGSKVYENGWTRSEEKPSRVVGIHHPEDDFKKIFSVGGGNVLECFEHECAFGGSFSYNYYWGVISNPGIGRPQDGSSGAPLYDNNKNVIGHIRGLGFDGDEACDATQYSYSGKFYLAWEGDGTPSTRLKDWLDPNSTDVQEIDGQYLPYIEAFTLCPGSPVDLNVVNLPNGYSEFSWSINGFGLSFDNNELVLVSSEFSPVLHPRKRYGNGSLTLVVSGAGCPDITIQRDFEYGLPEASHVDGPEEVCSGGFNVGPFQVVTNPGDQPIPASAIYQWSEVTAPPNYLLINSPNSVSTTLNITNIPFAQIGQGQVYETITIQCQVTDNFGCVDYVREITFDVIECYEDDNLVHRVEIAADNATIGWNNASLIIESNYDRSRVEVFSTDGKIVYQLEDLPIGRSIIELPDLPKGIYFVRLTDALTGKNHIQKIANL